MYLFICWGHYSLRLIVESVFNPLYDSDVDSVDSADIQKFVLPSFPIIQPGVDEIK